MRREAKKTVGGKEYGFSKRGQRREGGGRVSLEEVGARYLRGGGMLSKTKFKGGKGRKNTPGCEIILPIKRGAIEKMAAG